MNPAPPSVNMKLEARPTIEKNETIVRTEETQDIQGIVLENYRFLFLQKGRKFKDKFTNQFFHRLNLRRKLAITLVKISPSFL